MARSYLAIQATRCASERLFSKAGYIVDRYCTSLSTDNVGMLAFLATTSDSWIVTGIDLFLLSSGLRTVPKIFCVAIVQCYDY